MSLQTSPSTFNIRASDRYQLNIIIDYLKNDLGIKRIGLLYHDYLITNMGIKNILSELAAKDIDLVSEATFKKKTAAIKRTFARIFASKPQAVILMGPHAPIVEFIKLCRHHQFNAKFVISTFASDEPIIPKTGSAILKVLFLHNLFPIHPIHPHPLSRASRLHLKKLPPLNP